MANKYDLDSLIATEESIIKRQEEWNGAMDERFKESLAHHKAVLAALSDLKYGNAQDDDEPEVSNQKAIDALDFISGTVGEDKDTKEYFDKVFSVAIESLRQTNNPARAHWEVDGHHLICSNCHNIIAVLFSESEDNLVSKMTACPFCHARMGDKSRISNKEWVDFLSKEFSISRTSAKEMLHGMMKWKKEDNFKRTFDPLNRKE